MTDPRRPHAALARRLAAALASGAVRVVDLTQPLSETTPVIQLPEPFANTPRTQPTRSRRYDDRGPAWAWSWLEIGEHVGTHFDAPIHWITGRDGEDSRAVPAARLVGPGGGDRQVGRGGGGPRLPADGRRRRRSRPSTAPLPDGRLAAAAHGLGRARPRTGGVPQRRGRPQTPGPDAECARWLAQERRMAGFGVETVGTDAGAAGGFDPPFPAHHYLLGAGKYGLTQLANLAELPPTGAVLVVAPLRLVGGTGSPARVLALVSA